MSWRFYGAILGGIAAVALALALKASASPSLRHTLLAVAGAVVLLPGVTALVMYFAGATKAHIEASNAAFRAVSAATHLTYRELEGTAAVGRPPYAVLGGRYRDTAVEIALAGYRGGSPLRTTIRIVDFPAVGNAARLRGLAQGKAEVDLPEPPSPPRATTPSPSDARFAELLSSIAANASFVVFDATGLMICVNPRRSVLRWLIDFTDFDIETDPVRILAILDQALELTRAFGSPR